MILYAEKKKRLDSYTYKINSGGEIIKKKREYPLELICNDEFDVVIVFINGKFSSVTPINFDDWFDVRSNWLIKKAITEKIFELEKRYAAEIQTPK